MIEKSAENNMEKENSTELLEMFDELKTEQGRETFSYHVVRAGLTNDPRFLRMALAHLVRLGHTLRGRLLEEAFLVASALGISKESVTEQSRQYSEAESRAKFELDVFYRIRREQEQNRFELLKSEGAIDVEHLQRAFEQNDFETAYIIFMNIPSPEYVKYTGSMDFNRGAEILGWAAQNNKNFASYLAHQWDETKEIYDNTHPDWRNHHYNGVVEFECLEMYDRCFERAESAPYGFELVASHADLSKSKEEDMQIKRFQKWDDFYKKLWAMPGSKQALNIARIK